jgi:hypothetical protein
LDCRDDILFQSLLGHEVGDIPFLEHVVGPTFVQRLDPGARLLGKGSLFLFLDQHLGLGLDEPESD